MSIPAQPSFFAPRDVQLMKRFALGGAGIGAGAGLLTSLANYLGSIKEEADAGKKKNDDDTLYLNLAPGKTASVAGSLALAGGAVSGLGAYALVRNMYQKIKKKEIQDQLDAAQQGYISNLSAMPKEGTVAPPTGQPMSWTEGLGSTPVAAALLLGLASAGVTHSLLDKTFPARRPPSRRDPRRVVLRTAPEASDPGMPKEASEDDAAEMLVRLLMSTKSAALSEFHDIVSAIGQGRIAEVRQGLEICGPAAGVLVKGASAHQEEPYHSLGISLAVRDPYVGPSIKLMAAAEFNDHYPSYSKLAAAMDGDDLDLFCKVAGTIGLGFRIEALEDVAALCDGPEIADDRFDMEKEASLLSLLDDVLLAQTAGKVVGHGQPHPDDQDQQALTPEDNIMSGSSDSSNEDPNAEATPNPKPQIRANDPRAAQFENEHKDIIDAALAPSQ